MNFTQSDISAFESERNHMVAAQIEARGVRDPRVLASLRETPRHLFIERDKWDDAYRDHPVSIGCGQTISQPYMVAVMTEMLRARPEDRVLEIGTGCGYQTAVLARLVREVVSIERHAPLADSARNTLAALGLDNVRVIVGDGTMGYAECAPYDGILVTAGAPRVPPALPDQLADGGRLVAPVGNAEIQRLLAITRRKDRYERNLGLSCRFVPLVGAQGWGLG